MGQVVLILALAVAGCGRLGFDASVDGGSDDPSLIAHYACDDPGDGVLDETATGGPATCAPGACPTRAPGIRGDACLFDGVDDMLVISHVPALVTSQGVTATAWIRAERITTQQNIVGKPIGTFRNSWQLLTDDGGLVRICASLEGDAEGRCDATGPGHIATNTWFHVAYSWDGARHRAWVDGAVVLDHPIVIGWDASPLLIGADIDTGVPVNPFQGAIDDVRIYDRALSSAELQRLAQP